MENKRIVIREFGEPEVLELVEEEIQPQLKPCEVLVRIETTSACFTDTMIRKGMYRDVKQKPPFSPGYDLVGKVQEVGTEVAGFERGDRVAALTITGSYSRYLTLPASELVSVPEGVAAAEAVSLVLSYVTAYQMLHRVAEINTGDRVLIHGAGGAVGTALSQLGRLHGLEMYGTASSSKQGFVRSQGVIPIDYQTEDFERALNEMMVDGVNVAFDPIGGEHFTRSFRSLVPGGKLIAYGFYKAVKQSGSIPLDILRVIGLNLLPNRRSAVFYSIGSMKKKHPGWFQQDLSKLFELLKEGAIEPVIATRMPLEAAAEAHRAIEAGKLKGRLILEVS